MPDMLNAAELRRMAMECAAHAETSCDPDERDRLLTIRESLLALADSADWLNGRLPPQAARAHDDNRVIN